MSKISLEGIVGICHQGIDNDKNNGTASDHILQETSTTSAYQTPLNCKGEGIICTRKAANLLNSSVDFKNCAREDTLKCQGLIFFYSFPIDLSEVNPNYGYKQGFGEFYGSSRIHQVGRLLAIHGLMGWNYKSPILVVHHGVLYGQR